MENGRAGKVKKKKKEAEDMEQELLQEIASYWGTRAEGYSEVNEKELAGSQREAWLHVLEEQFPEKKKEEMKILDIGTGPGFFPMILSEAGYTVTAVDYTEEMLEKAKENLGKYTKYGLERVTLQRMDAQNLEFADETFDVVISRNGPLQVIHFHIYVNGHFLKGYSADGIIVSTPTGSTGYNLSAGGPIVEPDARLMVITPICPHTFNTRSIVLSPEDRIEIEIGPSKGGGVQEVEANFDGAHSIPMKTGDRIVIRRSEKTTSIIKLSDVSFLEVLHRKMGE